MKTKLIIATGAFALYGMGFLCAALDAAEAAEAVPAAVEAAPAHGTPAPHVATPDATFAPDCTAGIRGVADGEARA